MNSPLFSCGSHGVVLLTDLSPGCVNSLTLLWLCNSYLGLQEPSTAKVSLLELTQGAEVTAVSCCWFTS